MAELTDTQKDEGNGSFVNLVLTNRFIRIPGVDSFVIFPSNYDAMLRSDGSDDGTDDEDGRRDGRRDGDGQTTDDGRRTDVDGRTEDGRRRRDGRRDGRTDRGRRRRRRTTGHDGTTTDGRQMITNTFKVCSIYRNTHESEYDIQNNNLLYKSPTCKVFELLHVKL